MNKTEINCVFTVGVFEVCQLCVREHPGFRNPYKKSLFWYQKQQKSCGTAA